MPIAAVTRRIPESGLRILNEGAEIRVWPGDLPPTRAQLLEFAQGADGLLTLVTDRIDGELLDCLPTVKVVSNFAVGYDNIDVEACSARGVVVCNTPGVLTDTTADLAFSLLAAAARRIVEGADYVRAGSWLTWSPMLLLGAELHGATIGIIGFGSIGQAMARRARGFDMRVLYTSANRHDEAGQALNATFSGLDNLLRASDFVSVHCALTPETRGLLGAHQFRLMKPTAILVNTARGPVVNTDDLYRALREGELGAAALDVTDPEPLPADHPLLSLPNVLVVPHIGSASVAARDKMAALSARNLAAVLRDERPPHVVNPEALQQAAKRRSAPASGA